MSTSEQNTFNLAVIVLMLTVELHGLCMDECLFSKIKEFQKSLYTRFYKLGAWACEREAIHSHNVRDDADEMK